MGKRNVILAASLCLALVLSLLPIRALAAGVDGADAEEETETPLEKTVAEARDWLLNSADFDKEELSVYSDLLTEEELAPYLQAVEDAYQNGLAALDAAADAEEVYALTDYWSDLMYLEVYKAWYAYVQRQYTIWTEEFEYASDAEKQVGLDAIDGACAGALSAMAAAATPGEAVETAIVMSDSVYLAYALALLPDLYYSSMDALAHYDSLSPEEAAAFAAEIEAAYQLGIAALDEPSSSDAVDGVTVSGDDMVLCKYRAWVQNGLNWTGGNLLADYDAAVAGLGDTLAPVSDGERAGLRASLEEAAGEAHEHFLALADRVSQGVPEEEEDALDAEIEGVIDELQRKADSCLGQLLETASLNRLTASAREVRGAIRAVEERTGEDLSAYTASVDELLAEGSAALTVEETEGFLNDHDAVAAAAAALEGTVDAYDAMLREAIADLAGSGDIPETGDAGDLPMLLAVMALSAAGLAALYRKRLI